MRSDVLNDNSLVGNLDNKVKVLTASHTLTAEDSGSVIVLDVAGGLTVTLPSCATGLNFKFIIKTTFTTAGLINTAATDELYVGTLMVVDPATATDMNAFSADVSNDDTIDLGRNFYLVASSYYPISKNNSKTLLFLTAGIGSDFLAI